MTASLGKRPKYRMWTREEKAHIVATYPTATIEQLKTMAAEYGVSHNALKVIANRSGATLRADIWAERAKGRRAGSHSADWSIQHGKRVGALWEHSDLTAREIGALIGVNKNQIISYCYRNNYRRS